MVVGIVESSPWFAIFRSQCFYSLPKTQDMFGSHKDATAAVGGYFAKLPQAPPTYGVYSLEKRWTDCFEMKGVHWIGNSWLD